MTEIRKLATQIDNAEVKALAKKAIDLLRDIQNVKQCIISDAHKERLFDLIEGLHKATGNEFWHNNIMVIDRLCSSRPLRRKKNLRIRWWNIKRNLIIRLKARSLAFPLRRRYEATRILWQESIKTPTVALTACAIKLRVMSKMYRCRMRQLLI